MGSQPFALVSALALLPPPTFELLAGPPTAELSDPGALLAPAAELSEPGLLLPTPVPPGPLAAPPVPPEAPPEAPAAPPAPPAPPAEPAANAEMGSVSASASTVVLRSSLACDSSVSPELTARQGGWLKQRSGKRRVPAETLCLNQDETSAR